MTTYYLSSSASNGYAVGADVNDGLSKSTPWLTLTKAKNSTVAGDLIYTNAGDYSGIVEFIYESVLRRGTTYLQMYATNIIDGVPARGPRWKV